MRQPVLLQLPEELYERVRQLAEDSQRPLENVLLDSLALLFNDLPDDLNPAALHAFSDEQLWALVYRPFALAQDAHLRELTALGKAGHLSDAEQVDQYVLIRSQALVLLKQRGYDVEQRLRSAA